MFKMVFIFTGCLKWFSFSQFIFYFVLYCNAVGVAAIFFFLQSHYIGMLLSQSCTVGGLTRNGLTPSCSY